VTDRLLHDGRQFNVKQSGFVFTKFPADDFSHVSNNVRIAEGSFVILCYSTPFAILFVIELRPSEKG